MKRFKTSLAAWGISGAIIAFWSLNAVLPPDRMVKLSYSLALGAIFAVLFRYTKDFFYSLREGRQGYHILIVGVYVTYLVLFAQRLWAIALDTYQRPAYMVNSPVSPFISWMIMIAAILVAFAPDTENGAIANRSLILLGVALFVAGVISGVSITTAFG